jgi:hypothetical protein
MLGVLQEIVDKQGHATMQLRELPGVATLEQQTDLQVRTIAELQQKIEQLQRRSDQDKDTINFLQVGYKSMVKVYDVLEKRQDEDAVRNNDSVEGLSAKRKRTDDTPSVPSPSASLVVPPVMHHRHSFLSGGQVIKAQNEVARARSSYAVNTATHSPAYVRTQAADLPPPAEPPIQSQMDSTSEAKKVSKDLPQLGWATSGGPPPIEDGWPRVRIPTYTKTILNPHSCHQDRHPRD